MKLFPVNVDIKIHIINPDENTSGTVNYGMGLHRLPTEEDMPAILAKACEALPEGFRLMTRHESTMWFLREKKRYHGPNIALPRLDDGEEWHDPATANTYSYDNEFEDDDEL